METTSMDTTTKEYKRDLEEMESRRRRGMTLLKRGIKQADVARELSVSRQTVSTWNRALAEDPRAWQRKALGRPSVLTAADKAKLTQMLAEGATVHGFPTPAWTLSRVGKLIAQHFGPTYSNVHVMRLIKKLGFTCARPEPARRQPAAQPAVQPNVPDWRVGNPWSAPVARPVAAEPRTVA
jgi:transposase